VPWPAIFGLMVCVPKITSTQVKVHGVRCSAARTTQRLPQMSLIPEQRAVQQVAAKVLAPVDTTQRRKID